MAIAGIALFLLLAQNATPQQPAAPAEPASIEGVVAKAVTGESLSKVTVTLMGVPAAASYSAELQKPVLVSTPDGVTLDLESGRQTAASTGPGSGQSRQTMTTVSDGRFQFENVTPGTYLLKATSAGYSPTEYGQRGLNGRGMSITLKAGQKMQGVSLTMTPGGTITGRVVDANGDPLSRALVQAQRLFHQQSGRELLTVQAVPTDDKGEYRLFWLPPGKYYISATPPDDRMRTMTAMLPSAKSSAASLTSTGVLTIGRNIGTGPSYGIVPGVIVTSRALSNGEVIEEAALPVYYPSALDASAATPVDIRPGGLTNGIDIRTKPARIYRIRGMILISATGQPISATQIVLFPRNGSLPSEGKLIPLEPNRIGFEIAGVVPGSYSLIAAGLQADGRYATGILTIEVQGANLDNIIVTASPAPTIRGHISAESTIANASSNSPTYIVSVDVPLAGPRTGVGLLDMGMSVRQENFVLPFEGPGDYRINVRTPGSTYVQSMRLGGQDVLRDGIRIDGPTSETLEIVVRPNAGRLEGNVTAGRQKFANATVVLVPTVSLRLQTSLYQTVQTNVEGHFTFESVSPGSYKVFAWEDIEPFAWFDAEIMQNFENRGTEIVIREGAKESMELVVIPQ